MNATLRLALAALVAVAACTDKAPAVATADTSGTDTTVVVAALPAGEARLAVVGGNIWYKLSGKGDGIPVILLHGGPGFNSFYLKPFEALGDERVVVRYDQLGGGKSDGMTDTATMTIPHFVAELEALRAHLRFDKVHIVGHSWGTMLAMEYYRAHPTHVASLSLGGSVMSVPEYAAEVEAVLPSSCAAAVATVAVLMVEVVAPSEAWPV